MPTIAESLKGPIRHKPILDGEGDKKIVHEGYLETIACQMGDKAPSRSVIEGFLQGQGIVIVSNEQFERYFFPRSSGGKIIFLKADQITPKEFVRCCINGPCGAILYSKEDLKQVSDKSLKETLKLIGAIMSGGKGRKTLSQLGIERLHANDVRSLVQLSVDINHILQEREAN